mgnify:FL=1|jgi:glycosyltransferase involved in cell wall biosynthesis
MNKDSHSEKLVSVIIATAGRDSIYKTIKHLNLSSIIPEEIIIIIPKVYRENLDYNLITDQNIKIVETNFKGQVNQRIEGFKHSQSKYTIQLDDDCFVEESCIKRLVDHANSLSGKFSVGPIFLDKKSNLDYFRLVQHNKSLTNPRHFFRKVFNKILHGKTSFKSGSITKSGLIVHPRRFESHLNLYQVEWLCGGMVLHNTKDLILESYYPFEGKAYCEDLIHSEFLKRNNIDLYIAQDSICIHDYEQIQTSRDPRLLIRLWRLVEEQFYWFGAMKYFTKLTKRPLLNLYFMNAFNIIRLLRDGLVRHIRPNFQHLNPNTVCHIISGLGQGGAENALFRQIINDQSGTKHIVISLMGEGIYGKKIREANFKIYTLDMPRSKVTLNGSFALYKILKKEKPAVVQTWMHHADLVGGVISKLAGIKDVYWCIRGVYNGEMLSFNTKLTIYLCVFFSYLIPKKIISNSFYAKDSYQKIGYKKSKMKVIQNGYSDSILTRRPNAREIIVDKYNLDPQLPIFGMIARFDPFKDHLNLLDALEILKNARQFTCILVGSDISGENEILVESIKNKKLENNIILAGPTEEIDLYMSGIDIHILSSLDESFPNVIAEAMICGTPCVATDVGDTKMMLSDLGWVCPAKNSILLHESILCSLSDYFDQTESFQASHQEKCKHFILENFSFNKMLYSFNKAWFME